MSLRWTEEELEEYRKAREQGQGNREQGTGPREQGTGNREQERPKPSTMMKVDRAKRGTDEASKANGLQFNPTEDEEQVALFDWARVNEGKWPELSRLFHVPNGGSRGPAEAGRFKAMGVRKGVPDVFLDVPRGGFHGLRIEMKRRRGGVLSEEQADWIDWYNANGYRAVVCYGWDEARMEIEDYLRGGGENG